MQLTQAFMQSKNDNFDIQDPRDFVGPAKDLEWEDIDSEKQIIRRLIKKKPPVRQKAISR